METFVSLGIGLVALIVFAYVRWRMSPDQQARRVVNSLESEPIAGAIEGSLIKITGRAHALAPDRVRAPLSGRQCLGYCVAVEEQRRARRGQWEDVLVTSKALDFILEGATGQARIEAKNASLTLEYEEQLIPEDRLDEVEAYLSKRGARLHDEEGDPIPMGFDEGILQEGQTVVVVGKARWEVERGGYRGESKILVVGAGEEGLLIISHLPPER